MRFDPQTVPINAIDLENTSYKISSSTSILGLIHSVRQFGLLSPPIIQKHNSGYIVISGFRRIHACRQLGWIHVEARVVGAEVNKLDCLKVSIADNLNNRQLNIIEQSTAISKLGEFYNDDKELSLAADAIGFQVNGSFVKKLRKLCALPPELQESVALGAISLTVALEIGVFDNDSIPYFIDLIKSLNPTLNQQKEILLMIKEISKIQGISVKEIFDNSIKGILNNPDYTRNQKIQDLRTHLKRLRFPVIADFNDAFNKLIQRLDLPANINIVPPENFEGTNYSVILIFNSLKEFESQIQYIKALAVDPYFKIILSKDFADKQSLH